MYMLFILNNYLFFIMIGQFQNYYVCVKGILDGRMNNIMCLSYEKFFLFFFLEQNTNI